MLGTGLETHSNAKKRSGEILRHINTVQKETGALRKRLKTEEQRAVTAETNARQQASEMNAGAQKLHARYKLHLNNATKQTKKAIIEQGTIVLQRALAKMNIDKDAADAVFASKLKGINEQLDKLRQTSQTHGLNEEEITQLKSAMEKKEAVIQENIQKLKEIQRRYHQEVESVAQHKGSFSDLHLTSLLEGVTETSPFHMEQSNHTLYARLNNSSGDMADTPETIITEDMIQPEEGIEDHKKRKKIS